MAYQQSRTRARFKGAGHKGDSFFYLSSPDSPSKLKVLEVHPTAKLVGLRTKRFIVRDKHTGEIGITPWIIISREFYVSLDAWKDAESRL
jgi:hypothetical protein